MSVIIVGGGMAGATLALAISRLSHGALPVHLIEATAPESHAHPGFDGRAIALAAGTCQQLARIGVWQSLADCATAMINISGEMYPYISSFNLRSASALLYFPESMLYLSLIHI